MVMQMDGLRRPFDRSREPGLKKPRLAEDPERGQNTSGRPFSQRPVAPGNKLVQQRFRASDRDSANSDSGRGGYQPQPLQHQELVSQYKTALAELTFNSKPIITNLTIIAGENLHAAKAVAGTVCSNILEVPSDQKLPSLYLLDSIVKNIGRDYIKYFAARLPEVFCKAYRQVDPSVHSSMRHLFGTWKGVFPPQTLQIIDKELGFTPTGSSSSGTITSRPDLQSQRPPHSIHVNPKYLERQRLQSSRIKGMNNDVIVETENLSTDEERPERIANVSAGRSWVNAPVKMHDVQHSHKDSSSEMAQEKNINVSYGGYEYNSDLSRNSGLGRRVIHEGRDKSWSGAGVSAEEKTSGQKNGFTNKLGVPNYPVLKSANTDPRLPPIQSLAGRNSNGLSSNWKNSEEEEFMWDDMNSRLTDHGAPNISNDPRKDKWTPDDLDKLGYESQLRKLPRIPDIAARVDRETSIDSLSSEPRELGVMGQQTSSPWQLQESHSLDRPIGSGAPILSSGHSDGYAVSPSVLSGGRSSYAHMGSRMQIGLSVTGTSGLGSIGTIGKQRFPSLGSEMPAVQSPVRQHIPSPSLTSTHPSYQLQTAIEHEQDQQQIQISRPEHKASSISGNLNIHPLNKYNQDSASFLLPGIQLGNMQKTQPQDQASTLSVSTSQLKRHFPVSLPLQLDALQSELSTPIQKPKLPPLSTFGTATMGGNSVSGESGTSSLLAAVMKSGILSNSLVGGLPNMNLKDVVAKASQSGIRPSALPPIQSTSSEMKVTEVSSLGPPSLEISSASTTSLSQSKVGQPPLPPGPRPPSSLVSTSILTSNAENKSSTPISSLLSSLVAKGLISASKPELPSIITRTVPLQPETQSSVDTISSSLPASSVPSSSASPLSSTKSEVPASDPAVKSPVSLPQSATIEVNSIIGFEFRPDVIRKLHPPVISGLFEDIQYQCSICGFRLKLQEQLDVHLQRHASKKDEANNLNLTSRRWYANSIDWITGEAGLLSGPERYFSANNSAKTMDENQQMVPADENQFVCLLCGELFEDVYCQERDEWMFKGAVYMSVPSVDGQLGSTNENARRVVVHANCITESSVHELGLASVIKMERDV